MKFEIAIFLFALIICGCENHIQIPTHDMGTEFDYEHLDYTNDKSTVDRKLLQQIEDIVDLIDPKIICSFNSAFGRDVFKVYLVESRAIENSNKALFVTDYASKRIIDHYKFNTDSIFIDLLYDRSEPIEEKGLVFTFVNKEANKNNIITSFDMSINLKGEIQEGEITDNNKFTFQLLDTKMRYSGRYFYEVDSFDITLDLKDGIEREFYAFKLSLQTPKGCKTIYTHLKGIIENERFFFDFEPEKSIILTNDILKMNLELNQDECGTIEFQSFNLEKRITDENM